MIMQYDVTGGGSMEASVVELSVPVFKSIITLEDMQQNVKKIVKKKLLSLVVAL